MEVATGRGTLPSEKGDLTYEEGYYLIGEPGRQRPVVPDVYRNTYTDPVAGADGILTTTAKQKPRHLTEAKVPGIMMSAEGPTIMHRGDMIARSDGSNDLYAVAGDFFRRNYNTTPLP